MHPLRPGDPEKLGAYDLLGRLADGPRGVAFLGKESDGEEAGDAPLRVIKLLPPAPSLGGGDDIARLSGTQRVSSSYVARVLDAGRHGEQLYVVREHIQGHSLAEVVTHDGPLDADALERVSVGVLTALTAVHLAGITHRGLTPHNVIMGPDGPRVTDIDLGEPVGEVSYRAPEQINGLGYGPYADVFSWAAIMVFAATGKPPFGPDEESVLTGEPDVGEVGVLAEPLRQVALSALGKDVGSRPTTYVALLRVLGDKRGVTGGPKAPPLQPGIAAAPGTPVGAASGPQGPFNAPNAFNAPGAPGQPGTPAPGAFGAPGAPGVPGAFNGPDAPGAADAPIEGVPVPSLPPMTGQPMPGQPPMGGPSGPPQQPWGPPSLPQGQLDGPGPMAGVPIAPAGPGAEPPPEQQRPTAVLGQTVPSRPPRRFPLGLAAAVGALALLSGVGLWGAGQYASTHRFEVVAAANPSPVGTVEAGGKGGEAPSSDQGEGQGPGQPQGQTQTQPDPGQTQAEVTVPWGVTQSADPGNDVGPMVLPNDWTSQSPATPELSTVPTPLPITTQPVAPPRVTVQPPVAQPTVTVTASTPSTPTPSNEIPPQTTETPTPTPSESGTPVPTVTVTITPTPTVTETATPVPTSTATAAPTLTWLPTTAPTSKPKPTATRTAPRPSLTARPARNPHSPAGVCGSGFVVKGAKEFQGGQVVLLVHQASGEGCVVTMKREDVGQKANMSAAISVQNGGSKKDNGSYEYYAGPVKLPAKGKCVRYSGSVGNAGTAGSACL
ncbi:hypothetical protein ACGFJC_18005 [Nonomuraea fuscirosea]|uniref:serine/threonine protein kinase n=1 Tax=Nonomuraea fuscirosea TaxID=1291556 RepID=UPI00372267C4